MQRTRAALSILLDRVMGIATLLAGILLAFPSQIRSLGNRHEAEILYRLFTASFWFIIVGFVFLA